MMTICLNCNVKDGLYTKKAEPQEGRADEERLRHAKSRDSAASCFRAAVPPAPLTLAQEQIATVSGHVTVTHPNG